jgi:FkbH-like protein
MIDFNNLKKQVKEANKDSFKKISIAILGNYSTQFLSKSLGWSGLKRSFNFDLYNAEYDQIETEIYNPNSTLYAFNPEYIILTLSSVKLQSKFYALADDKKTTFTEDYINTLDNLVQTLSLRLRSKIIINNLEILNDTIYGNLFSKVDQSFTAKLYELNSELISLSRNNEAVYLYDLNGLIQYYGSKNIRDWSLYVNADLHFSLDFHAAFSEGLAGFIAAFTGTFKKCLILDLDNTLWGGIIGDDGMQEIQIGSLGIGKSYTELQQWIKQLKNRGIILAVCSKNTESIAQEPFQSHPEMVLKMDDIAVFVANWENKADNIRLIQKILNIGFDSMVFVDDNPAERELVRQNLPDVYVPELPEDPALYLDHLKSLHLFDTASYSATDKNRTKQYQQESERKKLEFSLTNIEAYLQSLEMTIEILPFNTLDISRIAQLSQRSNQFNLRTIRYSDSDILQISKHTDYLTVSVKLQDKFGDYGLIAVLILKKTDENDLFIDTWIMSCRVLKRGVEDAVLNYCCAIAVKNGFKRLVGEYIPTAKNGLVKDHYQNLGFIATDNYWYLNLENFNPVTHYIKEVNN